MVVKDASLRKSLSRLVRSFGLSLEAYATPQLLIHQKNREELPGNPEC